MTPLRAGLSDKYGQVYVERVGNTGFSDPTEPVAVFRAQDRLALAVLHAYLGELRADPAVPVSQIESVERQAAAFEEWRREHPEKVRTPGTVA
jgi:hypothetical protein